ncbi:DUF211 domain-containing protein [Halorussus lipolyticus]|uniref:DUF211 domain-containing protein n=1 Tax=Halorussus lipolyticus TaxID=3034024 RepID=UPI0023E75754|nr:DUF211 domain-containing protein [Halorussus sp. DT80]
MPPVRRIVADVLKPHAPSLVEFAEQMAEVEGVSAVNATVLENDAETQTIELTAEGDDVSADRLRETIENIGGSLHSIDEVSCGEYTVEKRGPARE